MVRRLPLRKIFALPLAFVLALVQISGAGLVAGAASNVGTVSTYGRAAPTSSTRTVPYFSDTFNYSGTSYPYMMVGANPRLSRGTTTVRAVIVPLRFVFADGNVSDPGTTAND